MRRVAPSAPRVASTLALAAAAAALALTLGGPGALVGPLGLVVLVLAFVPFVEWDSLVPDGPARRLPRVAAVVLFATGFLAWLSRAMGALVLEPRLLPATAGPLLLVLAVVFALCPHRFPPGRSLLPAVIGVLAVAGLDPRPEGYGATALSFLKGSEHTAFAERYLALALTATAALWTSAILAHGPRWSLKATATLAASFVLVGLLSATGIVGLPLFQPRVEKAFASAFADGATGLGGESTLGEFASLAVSRRRVLDLETSLASGGAWRLPSEVFTAFDGRRWFHPDADPTASRRSTTVQPMKAAPATSPLVEGLGGWFATGAAPGPGSVEMRVTQAEVTDWPLFAPRGTRAVTATAYLLEIDPDGLVRRPPGDALRLYGMLWSPVAAGADAALSADERAASLALPAVDPRTEALARRLANGTAGSDVRSRIDATVRHLQTGYRYTLAPGRFRTNDPLAEFLFEKKAAYCEYFATAAVVLLRLQGVPARYVKGLAVGPNTDQGGGLHVVRESDAHAWVEAFIPGEGWVEEDPTPPGDFRAAHAPASLLAQLVQRTRAALAQAWARLSARGPAAFLQWLGRRVAEAAARLLREPLAWLALVLALAARPVLRLVRGWLRQRARVAPDAAELAVPDDLRALVRALERRWAQAGRPRPAGRGLLEHARRLASGPEPLVASLGEAGTRIVEAYYRVRFGGDRASAAETSVLQERLLADGYNDGWVSR